MRWLRDPGAMLEACARRYGDCFTLRLWNQPPWVVFSDPEGIKDIFTGDPALLHAGEANEVLKSVLGENSLLLMDGERHLRERRLMMPPFHGERMRAYGETMRDVADRAIDSWPIGKPFAIHAEMQRITLEVILRTVFGLGAGPRLERMRALLVRYTALGTSRLGTALLLLMPPRYARRIGDLAMDPVRLGPFALDLSRLLPWRELLQVGREVDALIYEELAERRARASAAGDDVLTMLMAARDEAGQPMSDVELRDELLTLLLAGHETSATSLAWAIHRILEHPEVLRALGEERDRVTGPGPLDVDQIGNLAYLDATLKETMRTRPIISIVARKLKGPMRIGGRDLPAGVVAIACIHLAHQRAASWPDPERFDPARFLGKKPEPYEFFPFGGGTRRCVGMAFALYEMKIVLAQVLRRVRLRAAPGSRVRIERRGITLAPSGGVPVILDARLGLGLEV